MKTKSQSPESWASDPQPHALRVEVSNERSLLLPHNEFLFSELTSNGKEQSLRLVFATHEVVVHGHSLRRIETAMQRAELSMLTVLSPNDQRLIPDGQPKISRIIVAEVADLSAKTSQ